MKVYNLNIDTSKPTNQVVQMQRNATGLLSANITNDGKYIRNLSCTLYDGANEISATTSANASFGFKVDVSAEPKHVKIEAKSEPTMCEWEVVIPEGNRRVQYVDLSRLQLDTGVYYQDEFYGLAKFGDKNGYNRIWVVKSGTTNFAKLVIAPWNTEYPVWFYDANDNPLEVNTPISVDDEVEVIERVAVKCTSYTKESHTYPAVGYYTDYQLDTLVKPSDNAPYDGNYVEPIKEIEVDGVKFVPTTLSVDGVEYKVLAEAQPAPEPEPEEPTTNDGE